MTPRRLATIALTVSALLTLAGCGKMGDLERPGPMFGRSANRAPPPAPSPPVATVDRRDLDADDLPELPAPGQNSAATPQ